MKISAVLKAVPRFTFILIVISFFVGTASAAGYLKIGDIEGESTDEEHKDWIDVLSITEGITGSSVVSVGGVKGVGTVTFSDIEIVKTLDKSSVKLREAIAGGTHFPTAEIELTRGFDSKQETYLKWELTDVTITSVSLNVPADSGELPIEHITINFGQVKWIYTGFDSNGASKGKVEAGWDVVANKKI